MFTTNLARGEAIQRAVRAGMTCINDFGVRAVLICVCVPNACAVLTPHARL